MEIMNMQNNSKSCACNIIFTIVIAIFVAFIGYVVFSEFWFWTSAEIIAAVLVAWGCIGEWKLLINPPNDDVRHRRERQYVSAVALGVTMEVVALVHSIPAVLTLENDVATNQLQVAALTNKSLELSLQLERATSNNLVLRSNVVALELKMKPRTITMKQMTNFIFLTQKIKKIPVTVSIGGEGEDTESYAFQVRDMFSNAGFGIKEGGAFNIKRDPGRIYVTRIGAEVNGASIILIVPSDEIFKRIETNVFNFEYNTGNSLPIIDSTNEEMVFMGIHHALQQNGIHAAFWTSQWEEPRQFEILIPIKDQF